ncbi:MAG: Com family DNA-binding transcriptional regulator [Nitrospirota bacterium]|nr:Com family DNA-binding transcriptional regulator [Nitrospirota bacterium]
MVDKKANKIRFIENVLLKHASRRDDFDKEGKISILKPYLRCTQCNKLLAKPNVKGKIAAQIKCPRCGTVNEI